MTLDVAAVTLEILCVLGLQSKIKQIFDYIKNNGVAEGRRYLIRYNSRKILNNHLNKKESERILKLRKIGTKPFVCEQR